jgi:hypothetical protein
LLRESDAPRQATMARIDDFLRGFRTEPASGFSGGPAVSAMSQLDAADA